MNHYQQRISKIVPTANPAQVEAFMRVGHNTLDGLSEREFSSECRLCAAAAAQDPALANRLVRSYGL